MADSLSPTDRSTLFRILDANLNRATEGMRVVEEYARFVLEDRFLTGQFKQLRHDLVAIMDVVPSGDRIKARETQSDVGTTSCATDEYHRAGLKSVAAANQRRVEQSLRNLEEYGKLVIPQLAVAIEALRYRTYTLGRAVEITAASVERLNSTRLYVLVDGVGDLAAFEAFTGMLVQAGVDVIQLRDKTISDRELLARAHALRRITFASRTLFIVNDRADLAVLSQADGVHVGQDELPVKEARAMVGPSRLVGVSTHCLTEARQAVLDGADYLGCGPTFPSSTKQFDSFPGVAYLREVASEIALPAFAIGGVNAGNLSQVLQTGFRRVAVSSAISQASDPAAEVRGLRALLENVPLPDAIASDLPRSAGEVAASPAGRGRAAGPGEGVPPNGQIPAARPPRHVSD